MTVTIGDKTLPFPIVSFEPFLKGSPKERQAVAKELYDAFHNYGWVYLKDFGISEAEVDAMFATSKRFFERAMNDKMALQNHSASYMQGYTADGMESSDPNGGRSHKECYEHRRFNNDKCPPAGGDGFREFADEFFGKCFNLASEVLRALCLVMGIPENFWDDKLEKADPQLRMLRYHSIPKSTLEKAGNYRINPHTDYGLCTLLFQDQVGGLEVDPFHTGTFLPATPIPGTCVINVADLLQRLSNDKLRSTRHRVMLPQFTQEQLEKLGPNALLPDRYSTAFFVHPDPAVTIAPIVMEGEKTKYDPVNAGEWRTMITSRNHAMKLHDSKALNVATVAAA